MGPMMMNNGAFMPAAGRSHFAMVQTKKLRAMFRQGLLYAVGGVWQPLLQ